MVKAAAMGCQDGPEKYDLRDIMWYYIKEHFDGFKLIYGI